MSLFSSIGRLFKAIIKKIINVVKTLFKKLWPILLVAAAIYFGGPLVAGWITTAGGPAWLASAFTTASSWVGTAATTLVSWGETAWGAAKPLAAGAWTAFSNASVGTQAALVAGASYLIAPEETAEVISEAGSAAVGLAGSLLSSALPLVLGGGLLWLLLSSDDKPDYIVGETR